MGVIRTDVNIAPHQMKALRELENGNILWGGVGSGKSRVGMAWYVLNEEHEDLYVITTAKKRDSLDWEAEAAKFGVGKECNATLAGTITVDSWNNLEKYKDVKNAIFIFDEQRLVGSGVWTKTFIKIAKSNRWILLSATPGDTWLDYIPVFVANRFYANRTEFKREHVIYRPFAKYPVVERYVGVGQLVRQRNQILVHMPYSRETVRHPVNVWCEYDERMMKQVSQKLWHVFEDRPLRDKAEAYHVMRRVANTDPSRSFELEKLIAKHPRLIVFYNFNYELNYIRALTGTLWQTELLPYAEWNGHKHEEIPKTDAWVYAVQYAAGAEGWNCITTDATAFWSLPYSYKLWEQAHGRIDRMDTEYTDLFYYIMRSKAPIDWAIWRSLKSKKDFQTKDFDLEDDKFFDKAYQSSEGIRDRNEKHLQSKHRG